MFIFFLSSEFFHFIWKKCFLHTSGMLCALWFTCSCAVCVSICMCVFCVCRTCVVLCACVIRPPKRIDSSQPYHFCASENYYNISLTRFRFLPSVNSIFKMIFYWFSHRNHIFQFNM